MEAQSQSSQSVPTSYLEQWRTGAKIVAHMDLILTSIGLGLLLFPLLITLSGPGIHVVEFYMNRTDPSTKTALTSIYVNITSDNPEGALLITLTFAFLAVIQLLVAIRLIIATESGTDLAKAYQMSKTYRRFTYFFLFIQWIFSVQICSFKFLDLEIYISTGWIAFVLRFFFICHVNYFMDELKAVLHPRPKHKRKPRSDPIQVVV